MSCIKTVQARITKSSLWAAGVFLKRGRQRGAVIGLYSVKTVADRYKHAASHNKQ